MEYIRLSDCAFYRNERTNKIDCDTYISTENMLPNRAGITVADALPDAINVSKYLPNDILLSNIRPYFKKIWFANREGGCSNDILVVASKQNILASFLYYVLSDDTFFHYSSVTSKGTKMPRGTPNAIMKYPVPHPDEHDQQRIVSILSAYDNLIEVNKKRIKVLEQMAKNVYKEWFVRFRFSGHESVPFEDGLPCGWRIKKLSELSDFQYGKMPEKDGMADEGFPIFTGYHIAGCYKTYSHSEPMLVLIARGVGGTGEVRLSPPFSYITNLAIVFKLKRPELYKMYLFYLFSLNNLRYLDTGAAQSQITIDNLKSVRVVVPHERVLKNFTGKMMVIDKLRANYLEQNNKLIKQRDLLLPRLMSGKIVL